MKKNNADRRSFIKNAAFLGFGVPASLTSISKAQANTNNKIDQATDSNEANTQAENEFSIFITTDLHAQIHTHDEFFWENGKAVYKKRGGLAVLKTMLDQLRAIHPQNILYDGGDYFHGHGVASL